MNSNRNLGGKAMQQNTKKRKKSKILKSVLKKKIHCSMEILNKKKKTQSIQEI